MKHIDELMKTIESMKMVVKLAINYPDSDEQLKCAENDLENLNEVENIVKKYYEW